jgi:ATP-binding cassette subfamily F protein uup
VARDLLVDYPGAVVFVTHDRVFLQHVATRIVELDRGRLTSWPGDYATFVTKKEEWLATSRRAREVRQAPGGGGAWLRQGIKARRTATRGASGAHGMRAERAARRERVGSGAPSGSSWPSGPGQMVFEAQQVTKGFDGEPVIRDACLPG